MGYAGGKIDAPTYKSIGDHSETIQIDYDPALITYEDLLDIFWSVHYPYMPGISTQYASKIFYHDAEQKRLAEESLKKEEISSGSKIFTQLVPYDNFYMAEDYHQKYYLQMNPELKSLLTSKFESFTGFVDSTAVARVNGYIGGDGTLKSVKMEIEKLGFSELQLNMIDEYLAAY